MNIVYFGTDVFLDVFEYLCRTQRVQALYTYRKEEDYFTERNIIRLAKVLHIPVRYADMTGEETVRWFEERGCELFVTAEYDRRLPVPEGLLQFRGINFHSSLLPEGRSYYPVEITMAKGCTYGGVTVHKLASRLDSGDILMQKRFPVGAMDSIDLYLKCGQAALEMAEELLPSFERYWTEAKKQELVAPYWKNPTEEAMTIRHDMTVAQARERYCCFNRLTRIEIYDRLCAVGSFDSGSVRLSGREDGLIWVSDKRVVYGLRDGNIRVDLEEV